MNRRLLRMAAVCALLAPAAAQAQVATSLQIGKRMHLAGEPVMAVVTVTNHAGRDLVFQSDGRVQWLDFIVRDANGNNINPRGRHLFGAMKIAAGQTLAREVDLSEHFQLSQPGNFSVSAVVRERGNPQQGTTTNRAFFILSQGSVYWSQKVGVGGDSGRTREYRLINFAGDSKTTLYSQVRDGTTGQLVATRALGEVLMLRKPLVTVDSHQRMHVLYLATPSMWVHAVVNTDGGLVARQIHQRAAVGDPRLLTFPDGKVQIANSIPYDPKAAAEERAKIRKATERPNITY